MSDDTELVRKLRRHGANVPYILAAADAIEARDAEIEALRQVVRDYDEALEHEWATDVIEVYMDEPEILAAVRRALAEGDQP